MNMKMDIEQFPKNIKAICDLPSILLNFFVVNYLGNSIPIGVKAESHVVSVQCMCAQVTLR